jgi:glucose-1-phosphate cytidylyltransferase
MKAILLAGGLGTRIREETEFRPKPMVEVGGRPILWHIMKHLSTFGIKDFIIATGYKSNMIKEYFLNYEPLGNDFTISLGDRGTLQIHGEHDESDWTVTVAFTGDTTETGGRVLKASQYLDPGEDFFLTYGDGLANVNIDALKARHEESGKLATLTTVQPTSRFGVLDFDANGEVTSFQEKPRLDGWINIGFMILNPQTLSYFTDDCVLESGPLAALARDNNLSSYKHRGFWQPMDTLRESKILNDLWDSGERPWLKIVKE